MTPRDQDIQDMKTKILWPLHPILPVKNYSMREGPGRGPKLGVMYAHDEKVIVYEADLDNLGVDSWMEDRGSSGVFQALELKARLADEKKAALRSKLEAVPKHEYASVEAAVDAGWVVD